MNKRLFLAIDLPQNLKDDFAIIQKSEKLKQSLSPIKFRKIPLENFHITISFLGYIPSEYIDGLTHTVLELCNQCKSFPLSFSHFSYAPMGRPATMIWAVFNSDRSFQSFAHEVNISMRNYLRSVDRNIHFTFRGVFTPHVTLIRLNNEISTTKLPVFDVKVKEVFVNELILFESKLSQDGAIYSRLATFPLS